MKHIVLCTGFHRSGTSLMAQILHRSGIHMGDNLMAAHISNPDGHFEDMAAVIMHDKLLKASNTDWKYAGEHSLISNSISSRLIKRYIAQRNLNHTKSKPWGIKDPRAALFLNSWQTASDNALKTVLLYRHWTSCIASLYKRHSRTLAFDTPNEAQSKHHLVFWQQPELALRMWVTTNRVILNYINKHSVNTMLIAQESIRDEHAICETVSEQLEIPLAFDGRAVVKPILQQESTIIFNLSTLPKHLINEAEALYRQLNSLADLSHPNPVDADKLQYLVPPLRVHYSVTKPISVKPTVTTNRPCDIPHSQKRLYEAPLAEIAAHLKSLQPLKKATHSTLQPLCYNMLKRFPDKFLAHEWAGRLYFAADDFLSALHYFENAASLHPKAAYLQLLLGDTHKALGHIESAKNCYQKAIALNPNNKAFYFALSTVLLMIGDTKSAAEELSKAIHLGNGKEIHFRLQHLKCLRELDFAQYVETALRYWTTHHELPIGRMLTSDLIKRNYKQGRLLYNETVKHRLSKQDLNVWLQTTLQNIESDCGKAHLQALILAHWEALYGDRLDAFLREHSLEARHQGK